MQLFGLAGRIGAPAGESAVFLLGDPARHPSISREHWPALSDQGYVMRTRGNSVTLGGSPVAVLWAVYDLVERWGVTYTLNGDVMPRTAGRFTVPRLDVVCEPALRIRSFRNFNAHAFGPESWSLAEQQRVIDQLLKMRFNAVHLNIWPQQPFVHYAFRGVRKQTAEMFWGWRFPTRGMIGAERFGDEREFVHPSLRMDGTYEERLALGRSYMHGLMGYARRRGMTVGLGFAVTEFTDEFNEAFKQWCPPTRLLTGQQISSA